jgi:glycerate kinase
MAFCGAELRPGVELALDAREADRVFQDAAFAITAEGMIDAQTLAGKLPLGVARRARRQGVAVVAVGGGIAPMDRAVIERFHDEGIVLCSSIENPASEEVLMDPDGTRHRLRRAAERITRLVDLGRRL